MCEGVPGFRGGVCDIGRQAVGVPGGRVVAMLYHRGFGTESGTDVDV